MPATVLVTRPAAQATRWVARLRERGVAAEALPLLAIAPLADLAPPQRAWAALASFDLVMFVSPNAVLHFFAARPAGAVWPPALRAAATGPGSVEALVEAGVAPALCVAPERAPYDSAHLWARLRGEAWAGRRVLIVRGDGGRDEFAQALQGAGATVEALPVYARGVPHWSEAERACAAAALAAPAGHLWLLSSAQAIGHLPQLLPGASWQSSRGIVTHPRIAAAARQVGFGRVAEAEPGIDAIVAIARALGAAEAAS